MKYGEDFQENKHIHFVNDLEKNEYSSAVNGLQKDLYMNCREVLENKLGTCFDEGLHMSVYISCGEDTHTHKLCKDLESNMYIDFGADLQKDFYKNSCGNVGERCVHIFQRICCTMKGNINIKKPESFTT